MSNAAGTNVLGGNVRKKCGAVPIPTGGTVTGHQHTGCSNDEGHEGKHRCPVCGQD